MNAWEIIDAIEAIEKNPPKCLPDPCCNCPVCERYCELHGLLDALNGNCCMEPRILGGKCENCGIWREDLDAR